MRKLRTSSIYTNKNQEPCFKESLGGFTQTICLSPKLKVHGTISFSFKLLQQGIWFCKPRAPRRGRVGGIIARLGSLHILGRLLQGVTPEEGCVLLCVGCY